MNSVFRMLMQMKARKIGCNNLQKHNKSSKVTYANCADGDCPDMYAKPPTEINHKKIFIGKKNAKRLVEDIKMPTQSHIIQ